MGQDALHYIFDYDTPLLRTSRELLVSPAQLIRNYIKGERKKYVHPIRYFILILAVYLIFKQLLDFDPIQTFEEATGIQQVDNPEAPFNSQTSDFFARHIDYFLPVFITTLAVISRFIFRKSGVYLAEYLTLSLFVISEYFFLSIFTLILSSVSPGFFLLNYLIVFLYPLLVLIAFHTGNLLLRILKSAFVVFIAWWLYVFLSNIISAFIISIFNL